MKNEANVIYFDEKEFTKEISKSKKLIPDIQGIVNDLKSIGFEAITMAQIAGLESGPNSLIEVWSKMQPESRKSNVEKFQAELFEAHLEKKLKNISGKLQIIKDKCYRDIYNAMPSRLELMNYTISQDGKVELADSFIEETRADLTVFCDTPEKAKALDLAEKANKALNDLQGYLQRLSEEGAVYRFNAVALESSLLGYNYESNQFNIDYSMFEYVKMKPRKRK